MKKFAFVFTVSYFILGMVNIGFATFGLICMLLPMLLLIKNGKKTWCQKMCPRSALFVKVGKLKNHSRSTPKSFIHGKVKWGMLVFFLVSFTLIIFSTIRVAMGATPNFDLRFMMFVPIPFKLPQLITIDFLPIWVLHFSYRLYSLMLSTTLIGLALALIYKPKTWCTICPISTVSNAYIKNKNKSTQKSVTKANA